eukprot:jgi/Galph1/5035/GphlegSOOS_G59.1
MTCHRKKETGSQQSSKEDSEEEEEFIVRPSRTGASRKRKRSLTSLKESNNRRKNNNLNPSQKNKKKLPSKEKTGSKRSRNSSTKTQRLTSGGSSVTSGRKGSESNSMEDFSESAYESDDLEEVGSFTPYEDSETNELSGPVMEKIVAMRVVKVPKHSFVRDEMGPVKEERQYLIKWKNLSYIHCDWVSEDFILAQPQGKGRLQRFRKSFEQSAWKRGDEEFREEADPMPEEWAKWTTVDRILAEHLADDGIKEYLVKWCALPYSESTWETENDIHDYSKIQEFILRNKKPSPEMTRGCGRFRKPVNLDEVEVEFKNGGSLREYQIIGSILADEMGLGKTLQTITFLSYLYKKERIRGPFLIVAPLSTVEHWKREFETWTDMNVVVYHGNVESRAIIHQFEWGFEDNIRGPPYKFNAVVTTYESIIQDPGKLRSVEWEVMIVDEAHRLKNRQAKLVEELRAFSTKHRILLTGTPIQNSSSEVWALLNFLEPEKFSSEASFLQEFAEINNSETAERFREMLRPYMLRRQKEDVEKSIPPKEEKLYL